MSRPLLVIVICCIILFPVLSVALTLDECLSAAQTNNPLIEKYRQQENSALSSKIRARSRFYPHLSLEYNFDDFNRKGTNPLDSTYHKLSIVVSQRLWEFGPENISSESSRELIRNAIFQRKEINRQVRRDVRIAYRSALLKQEQKRQQEEQYIKFRKDLDRANERLKAGKNTEVDVYTVELSFLTAEERILDLETQRRIWLARLERLTGKSLDYSEDLTNPLLDSLRLTESEVVKIAHSVDPSVELLQLEKDQAKRDLDEEIWQWVPEFSLEAGIRGDQQRASISTTRFYDPNSLDSLGTWSLDVAYEKDLARSDNYPDLYPVDFPDQVAGSSMYQWDGENDTYALLAIQWPLFEGLDRIGSLKAARAKYHETIADLREYEDRLELSVKQANANHDRMIQKVSLSGRRLEIARRRLEIKTTLREFGRITDEELEYFRQLFFNTESEYYTIEEELITVEEELRYWLDDGI